ncbi:MAG: hypothetical protein FWG63_08215 [Defluviitaleaceae bacterium]|nr:hypothetical protein [Defluviitaleaceae bacterium]
MKNFITVLTVSAQGIALGLIFIIPALIWYGWANEIDALLLVSYIIRIILLSGLCFWVSKFRKAGST